MDISLSNVELTLTQISTTATSSTIREEFPLKEIRNISTASTIRSVELGFEALPTIVRKAAASGSGNLTLSSALRSTENQTYFFDGASNVVTITGNITVSNMAIANTTLYFDVERFLTAQ